MSWLDRLRRLFSGRRSEDAELLATRALQRLEDALAESDAEARLAGLREALEMAERVTDTRGDQLVLEASLHLGERLRAAGERDAHRGVAVGDLVSVAVGVQHARARPGERACERALAAAGRPDDRHHERGGRRGLRPARSCARRSASPTGVLNGHRTTSFRCRPTR